MSLMTARNMIVAPVSEEVVFRASCMPLLLVSAAL
jgi:hypothetical protein